jgi:hypothetical protein
VPGVGRGGKRRSDEGVNIIKVIYTYIYENITMKHTKNY